MYILGYQIKLRAANVAKNGQEPLCIMDAGVIYILFVPY
jgi:hypothetical protein